MSMEAPREVGVWRQTRALLYKNCLVKWRTKKSSSQEVLLPIFFLFWLVLMSMMYPSKKYEEVPDKNLGSVAHPKISQFIVGFTPITPFTRKSMTKMSSECFEEGIITEEFFTEEDLQKASLHRPSNFVGVVFKDSMSYYLRFPPTVIPLSASYVETTASCPDPSNTCEAEKYLRSGFTALQMCLDAAIIQLHTNHSVLEDLEFTNAVMMGKSAIMEIDNFARAIILIYLVIAFSPFGCYLATHIVAEKEKKLKEFLMVMGLHDTAFWLSWVLLYTSLIFVMSLLMSIIATYSSLFPKSSSFVIFLLFFLYGLSSVFFAFMLTPLFKKSKHIGTIEFLTTLAFGFVGLTIVILEDFPKSFVWLLSPLCQCTFLVGIAQVMHLEDYEEGAVFSSITYGPYPLVISVLLLALDSMLYLLVAVYLDQVIPGEYGLHRSSFFFLKPSFWLKRTRNYKELYEAGITGNLNVSEMTEPVPPEFQGKEAIRISGVQKSFVKKDETVEALKGLSFDIYEGQITALLGHSGTGKTTLMNVLCGLCPPSDGFASIYGYRVSEIDEMLDVRKITGVCQQSDIYFDVLTVEENLSIVASVKGIPPNDMIQEVQKMLLDLDMQPIKDNQVKKLSGGQKRKLSIGFAIIGDPKVLLLDEPTAGMDPCSRRAVWNILKSRKANRVTVFSTHFMDEADIIADRKAVISQGMLKCVGSSFFLKTKWGIGYRLSMHIDRYCNTEGTSSLVRQHIPGASLLKQNEEQLVYGLPFKDMDKFSALFSDLDTHSHLGFISYGVSMTTLEDVFLKLEVEAEIDQADFSVFNPQQAEDELDAKSISELEQSLLILSETKSCAVSNKSLWRKQVLTMAKVHFLSLQREIKSATAVFSLFTLFLLVQILLFLIRHYLKNAVLPVKLSPDLYFLKPKDVYHKYKTSLLVQNSTESDIEDIIRSLRSQNILTEIFNGSDYVSSVHHNTILNGSSYVSIAPHSAAINVFRTGNSYTFAVAFNRTMVHSLPVMLNVISNLYLNSLNVTESITIWSSPFFQEFTDTFSTVVLYFGAVLLGIIITGMPPYFAMENAENHKIKAYTQLKISGLYPSAYWCGQALIDIPLFYIILLLMIGSLFVFHHEVYFFPEKFLAVVFSFIGYVPSIILFTYIVSFTFKTIQNTKEFWSFIFSMAALVCSFVIELVSFMWSYTAAAILHTCFSIFVPIYPLIGSLISFIKITQKHEHKMERNSERLLVSVVAPYFQCVMWIFLLRYLEVKYGGKSIREDPFFRTPVKPKPWKFPDVPHDEDEDEDVKAERLRIKEMTTCQSCEEKPAILVSSLHKEYDEKRDFLLGRRIKKVATNHVSLCVKKGEILGLLGPNGSGKSTLINMLVGEVEPTSGQMLMGDYSLGDNGEDTSMRFVGYCPQTNPLWPDITLQEHFEIYGAIKGMRESDMKQVIKCVSSALDFKEHLQKKTKKLAAGIKRKLCFALSMLGNPYVTLLDEPSASMDPKAKQHMWKAIRASFKTREKAAILTTHYMEEADAICDRVAILVSGKLRCIGTVQHLKSKFGKGYYLEIKLKEVPDTKLKERLQREILHIFPNANHQESFASILAYKVPKEDVHSLALSFSKLEEAKHAFNIEEYSFSQATLEQVFVELAREQEEEDSSFGTLNSTLWWERSQGDKVVF
ncbi:cholesterol transporter ABCA5 isoform X1 [Sphaerodactylus townsendi]|uniref:cholesterol transporter ABCA5 isoform X1 n=2 Tax=Sphaerodactylus townsendi TaxID=933632 RepID=UPI002026FA68|nr:cholesterol transporter ABCA5 isoform X1 [Sphaerodactylus townsendi]XP_048344339.1 cholesterol transporter ABCA5 isoform X1 [Sphaerodactylus townsendi]XP_048344340.1 cholesterol transporter ABCA5 isoform X1 [Sphaerodactylus townsendi]XP_048344341.1 cholesterol transporter ABCA5 isoform X1 [Sphaerodactylus townsendi]